jgi:hypothetical protein
MFANRASFECILGKIAQSALFPSVYISSHGDKNSLSTAQYQAISRAELRNSLRNRKKNIKGIYLSSCMTANMATATFILKGRETNWDWIDSVAIDIMFWSRYFEQKNVNDKRGGLNLKHSELQMVIAAAQDIRNFVPNIFKIMGSSVYFLDGPRRVKTVWS